MSLKLHEITKEVENFDELYEQCLNHETGELDGADTLTILEDNIKKLLEDKGEGLAKYILNLEAEELAYKNEIDRLAKKKKSIENKKNNFMKYIEINMLKMGVDNITNLYGKFSLRKSSKVIINENIINKDPRFWKQDIEDKFDKVIIKKLLKTEVIAGASLLESKSLNFK